MSRRKLSRFIKAEPPDNPTAEKYLLHWNDVDLYYKPNGFPKLDSEHLFGNRLPLKLEVGCGTGEFLCSQSLREPTVNFIGVDIYLKALFKAVEMASSLSLDNIKFIRANFQLMNPLTIPDSLLSVYLHFPDPNYEVRFRKHRIFTQAFLNQIHCALVPGGRLSVMTDEEELFMDMLNLTEQDTRFEKGHKERYLVGAEDSVKSRYQRIWERHGLPTLRFEVQKHK